MSYNTQNYTKQGGEETVIGGTLDLTEATIKGVVTAEVVNNLTTSSTGKALDAAQGKALKDLIDVKYTAESATKLVEGLVLQSELVSEAVGATPTASEFKALLDALKAAGIMASE